MKVIELIKMTFEKNNIPVSTVGTDLKIELGAEHVYFIEYSISSEKFLVIRELKDGKFAVNERVLSIPELNNKIDIIIYRFRQLMSFK